MTLNIELLIEARCVNEIFFYNCKCKKVARFFLSKDVMKGKQLRHTFESSG